jgi:hypothetical protein
MTRKNDSKEIYFPRRLISNVTLISVSDDTNRSLVMRSRNTGSLQPDAQPQSEWELCLALRNILGTRLGPVPCRRQLV